MSDNITFRGAILKHFDVRQGKEGGDVFCRINFSADWSEQVRDKMEWEPVPDSITECKLTGSLLATHLILTPGDKALSQHQLQFDVTSVEDFQVVSLKDDEGDVRGRELRFVVRTPSEAEGFLGQYIRRVGRHAGALKVVYVKQEKLDLGEGKPEKEDDEPSLATSINDECPFGSDDGPCISCNNRIPFEDEDRLRHVNGMACCRGGSDTATLASAREAAGGTTDALKKRRGRPRKDAPVAGNPTPEERAALDAETASLDLADDGEGAAAVN